MFAAQVRYILLRAFDREKEGGARCLPFLLWKITLIRFSFLPNGEDYQDPGKHIASFLRGIPMFAAVAAIAAGIVTMIG